VKHTVEDTVDAKVAFQEWCRLSRLRPLDADYTAAVLLEQMAQRYYFARQWQFFDVVLTVARERRAETPRLRSLAWRRCLPPWLFRAKALVDFWVGRLGLHGRSLKSG